MNSKVRRAIDGEVQFPRFYATIPKPNKPITKPFEIAGFDIEADAETADPFLICASTHNGDDYKKSNGKKHRKKLVESEDPLAFLALPQWNKTINGFWNIGYDSEGIMRFLPDSIKFLLSKNPEVFLDHDLNPSTKERFQYQLRVIPKKAFYVRHVLGPQNKFFDFQQFFGKQSLDKVAKRLLNDSKDKKINAAESSILRYWQDEEYRLLMDDYCSHDADLTARLGRYLVQAIHKFLPTKNFVSCASIAEQYITRNGFQTPSVMRTIHSNYLPTYWGGRFEPLYRGFIPDAHSSDLKSAYPWAMSIMPILTETTEQRLVHNEYNPKACYGAYYITIFVPFDDVIGPVPYNTQGPIIYPTGEFKTWVDKETLIHLTKNYDVIIHKGYELFDDNATAALSKAIHYLYSIKENKSEDEGLRMAAKVILNSIYGKMIQLMDDTVGFLTDLETAINENLNVDNVTPNGIFAVKHTGVFRCGRMFNPPYAAFITAKTRIRLLEAAQQIGYENIVSFQTDSISSINKRIPNQSGLGGWDYKGQFHFLQAKSGVYQYLDPETFLPIETKARSYGKIDDISKSEYTMNRRVTLKECATKRDFTRLNVIERRTIKNNLNTDAKRIWQQDLKASDLMLGGRMIPSKPIIVQEQ